MNQRGQSEARRMLKRSVSVIVGIILLASALVTGTVSGCRPVSASQNQEPIEVMSVVAPIEPINPGGPGFRITLKNVDVEPVISLTATLEVHTAHVTSVIFTFDDVTPSHPLQPNRTVSAELTLIGGGLSYRVSYPLTINGTLQDGDLFSYTKQVHIKEPPAEPSLMPAWGWPIIAVVTVIIATAVIVIRRRAAMKA